MKSNTTATPSGENVASTKHMPNGAEQLLKKGNREVVTDFYVAQDVNGEQFPYRVFVRLNAKKVRFTKVFLPSLQRSDDGH